MPKDGCGPRAGLAGAPGPSPITTVSRSSSSTAVARASSGAVVNISHAAIASDGSPSNRPATRALTTVRRRARPAGDRRRVPGLGWPVFAASGSRHSDARASAVLSSCRSSPSARSRWIKANHSAILSFGPPPMTRLCSSPDGGSPLVAGASFRGIVTEIKPLSPFPGPTVFVLVPLCSRDVARLSIRQVSSPRPMTSALPGVSLTLSVAQSDSELTRSARRESDCECPLRPGC